MDYAACLRYLYSQLPMYQRIGAAAYKADLGNTLALLKHLGNPEQGFRSIHVAGTNGKGSVSHLLASVLQSAGYRTGLYTSPHLKDFRERIRINGEMIPEDKVVTHVSRNKGKFDEICPSFFEMTVGLAFEYFAEMKVDVAVIETGMGGRLDSTNVLRPLLSIITNIGHDHMQFLGPDLASIAKEKAGIIKPGTPVIIGQALPETREIFVEKAMVEGAPIHFAKEDVSLGPVRKLRGLEPLAVFDIRHRDGQWLQRLSCPLTGDYQQENYQTVFCALHHLSEIIDIPLNAIVEGYRQVKRITGLKGRWEILSERPFIVADTAHNPEGLRAAVGQWMSMPFTDRHIVLGMVDDKDPGRILRMFPKQATYYFCRPEVPRGRSADELLEFARILGLKGKAYGSVKEALTKAKANVSRTGSIYVGGSTFVVAEIV
jgi:dihydrofolate synthase/folylpolyglutamate synthase